MLLLSNVTKCASLCKKASRGSRFDTLKPSSWMKKPNIIMHYTGQNIILHARQVLPFLNRSFLYGLSLLFYSNFEVILSRLLTNSLPLLLSCLFSSHDAPNGLFQSGPTSNLGCYNPIGNVRSHLRIDDNCLFGKQGMPPKLRRCCELSA